MITIAIIDDNQMHAEDIKKLLYAGCMQVMLNAAKKSSIGLAEEASQRFGKDRIVLMVDSSEFSLFFK